MKKTKQTNDKGRVAALRCGGWLASSSLVLMLQQLSTRELLTLGCDPWFFDFRPAQYVEEHETKIRAALIRALK
jgi:hypothetical protein